MIEATGLTKRYGEQCAIQDVSFTIRCGEILGFLGQNGAGKSTTMNIITGYIAATAGSVALDGVDVRKHPREFKRHIGYLPETPPLYPEMTVNEYLRFVCEIKEVKRRGIAAHTDHICRLLCLNDHKNRLIRNLSKGYRQRVGMAQALIGSPKAVILDEPTVGLDPRQIIEIRHLIQEIGTEHAVVLSSHILNEVAETCQRAVVIHKGRIVAQDSIDNLTRGSGRLLVRVAGSILEVRNALSELAGFSPLAVCASSEPGCCDLTLDAPPGGDIRLEASKALMAHNLPILLMQPASGGLEEMFLRLTGKEGDAQA